MNNHWYKILRKKLQREISPQREAKILGLVKSEMSTASPKRPFFDWKLVLAPGLGFALFLVIFFGQYQARHEFPLTDPTVFNTLVEHEELLDNLNVFSEIEEVDALTETEWDLLLEDVNDA